MGMRNVETGNVKMKEAEEKRAENNCKQKLSPFNFDGFDYFWRRTCLGLS